MTVVLMLVLCVSRRNAMTIGMAGRDLSVFMINNLLVVLMASIISRNNGPYCRTDCTTNNSAIPTTKL